MALFSNKYQKTGFLYSLMLSFIYLPLVLGIIETNKFIENQIFNFIVFIPFTITFITTINYKIILSIKNVKNKFLTKYLLAPINIVLMFLFFTLSPFIINKNIFILGLLFLIVPWCLFFIKIKNKHLSAFSVA